MRAASEDHLPEHKLRTGCIVKLAPYTAESAVFDRAMRLTGIVIGISDAHLEIALDNAVVALERRDARWTISHVSNSAIFDR